MSIPKMKICQKTEILVTLRVDLNFQLNFLSYFIRKAMKFHINITMNRNQNKLIKNFS